MSKLHRPSSKTCFGSVPEYPKVPKLHRPSYKLLFRIRFKRLESEQMAPKHACETIFGAPEVVRLRRQRIENYGSVTTSRRRLRRKKKAAGEHHSKTGPESGRKTYENKLPNPPFLMTISRKSVPFFFPPFCGRSFAFFAHSQKSVTFSVPISVAFSVAISVAFSVEVFVGGFLVAASLAIRNYGIFQKS